MVWDFKSLHMRLADHICTSERQPHTLQGFSFPIRFFTYWRFVNILSLIPDFFHPNIDLHSMPQILVLNVLECIALLLYN